MKTKNYVALESPISSICNLDCTYCYIPKNNVLKKIHKKWKEKVTNGEYLEILSENFELNDLQALSFWGAEPSLGMLDFPIKEILDNMPDLKSISTSTNLTTDKIKKWLENTSKFMEKENTDRTINIDIQISLDGPKYITDKNRGKGTFDKIIKNISELNRISKSISNKMQVVLHVKSTNDIDNFRKLADEPIMIKEYLETFKDLQEKYEWPNNFKAYFSSLPTLVMPGDYTKEDGLVLAKYGKEFMEISNDLDEFNSRFFKMAQNIHARRIAHGSHIFNCSAGRSSKNIDMDGTTHGCHGTLWYNYKDYLDTIDKDSQGWKEGKRVLKYEENKFSRLTENIMANHRDDLNKSRINYLYASYMENPENMYNIYFSIIKMLAISDQVSEIYKKDSWAKLLAMFIIAEGGCWMNSVYTTGSMYVAPFSVFRLIGNGYFEQIVHNYYKLYGSL